MLASANWYAIDTVGSYRALLCHGDQFRGGFAGFPFLRRGQEGLGLERRRDRGAVRRRVVRPLAHADHADPQQDHRPLQRLNGEQNTYAAEQLAASGRPSQRLAFIHPERGVTAEYLVWLDA